MKNPFSLDGKTILVTGASSGIGQAIARTSANMGAKVICIGRNPERLQETLHSLSGEDHRIISVNLADIREIPKLVDDQPLIDGLVLCAGKGLTLPVQFSDLEHFEDIFNLNFYSTVELVRLMYKKKKIKKGGSIVMITSMGGTAIFSGSNCIYGTSKAALNSFMKYCAKEFSPRQIRANAICPGMVDTPLIHRGTISEEQLEEDAKKYPLKRYGLPEDIANAAVYLLSDAASWVTGSSLIIDGGLSIR